MKGLPGLKAIRERKGVSQKSLAEMVGVTEATICRYETGARSPRTTEVALIAEQLGVPIARLMQEPAQRQAADQPITSPAQPPAGKKSEVA